MNTLPKNENKTSEAKTSSSEHNFPIVGIGASTGGLDAVKQLLKAIPENSGMAFVLVQHLNPAHESNVTEILSRITAIPIEEITDEVKIFPNHIYVMPSGKILTAVDGVLKLTTRDTVELQSANKELQSSNEEMQSLNEELENSKEKLQAANEELITLKQELLDKQEQLNASRLYDSLLNKQLQESEARLGRERQVLYNSLMNAPAGISILKGDTHIYEFVNAEYEKLVDRKITLGKTVQELFPEIEQQGLIDILNNVFLKGEPFIANEFPVELIDKRTGKMVLRYYNSVVQPIKDGNGNTERLLSHGLEVTQQVEARKLIEASEQRLSDERMVLYNSFMNAPAGIAIYKGDTHIYEFANVEHEKTARRKITIGKTVQALFPELEQQGLMAMLKNVFLTGEPFIANELPIELNNEGNDKSVLGYFNLVVQPLKDAKGNTERLLSHAVDVTQQVEARKQIEESEKRFSMLADSIPNLAWMAYADGNIFWYNKKWFEYTGTRLADMEGWGWQAVHDPVELPKVLTKWKASIETGQPFEMVFPIKGADGEFRQFLTRVLPVYNSENKIDRWFGTNTDITEQKTNAEEKFLLEFAEEFSHYETGTEFFGSLVTYIANKTHIDYVFIGELTEKEKNIFTIKTIALANRGTLVPNIEYPLPDGPCEQVMRGTVYNYPNQCRITFPKNQTFVQVLF